jgi:CRP-like cAMP-binding protein
MLPLLPLISTSLAALLWLVSATLGHDASGVIETTAFGMTVLAAVQCLHLLLVNGFLRFDKRGHQASSELLQTVSRIALYGIGAMVFLRWGLHHDVTSLLATSAMLTIILGMALQPTLGHLFSGVSIEIERPFKVGDCLRFDNLEGQVLSMNWRSVYLRTGVNTTILLPNSVINGRALEVIAAHQPYWHTVSFTVGDEHAPGHVIRTAMRVFDSGLQGMCENAAPDVFIASKDPVTGLRTYRASMPTLHFMQRGGMGASFLERLWYALSREQIENATPAYWPSVDDTAAAPAVPALFLSFPLPLQQLLMRSARTQRYGRHECLAYSEPGELQWIIQGELRESAPRSSALERELESLLLACEVLGRNAPRRLAQLDYVRLLEQGYIALGPLAQNLCERIAAHTDNPWLAWQAFSRSIDNAQARAEFLCFAPSVCSRVLQAGEWLGWSAVLSGERQMKTMEVSRECTLLVWSADMMRRLLQEASELQLHVLIQQLQKRKRTPAPLLSAQFHAWIKDGQVLPSSDTSDFSLNRQFDFVEK